MMGVQLRPRPQWFREKDFTLTQLKGWKLKLKKRNMMIQVNLVLASGVQGK